MKQNFIVTNAENQDYASTKAQELSGTVLALGTSIVGGSTNSISNNGVPSVSVWTLKPVEWHTNNECGNNFSTYSDSEVEDELLRTGIAISSTSLPVGLYAVVFPASIANKEEAIMSYIVDTLRRHDNFATIAMSDTYLRK